MHTYMIHYIVKCILFMYATFNEDNYKNIYDINYFILE